MSGLTASDPTQQNFFNNLRIGGGSQQAVNQGNALSMSGTNRAVANKQITPFYNTGGQVLGASTGPDLSNPAKQTDYAREKGFDTYDNFLASLQAQQGPAQQEIDNAFNPTFDLLNQAESTLNSQMPGLIGEAEQQAKIANKELGVKRDQTLGQLGQQELSTEQKRRTNVADQTTTLNELNQANQARFGSTSGLGQFASEIQGREFQRGTNQTNQEAQRISQEIFMQKQKVQEEYNINSQRLDLEKNKAISQLQREYQNKLLEINSNRVSTAQAKAQARISLAQEFRNAAFRINSEKAQFELALRQQAQQNTSYLDQVAQQYTSLLTQGQQGVDQYANAPQQQFSTVSNGTTQGQVQPTGQISQTGRQPLTKEELTPFNFLGL